MYVIQPSKSCLISYTQLSGESGLGGVGEELTKVYKIHYLCDIL